MSALKRRVPWEKFGGTIYLRIAAALSFKGAYDNPTPRHEAAASTKKSLILAWRPGVQFCATSIAAANVGSAIVRSPNRWGAVRRMYHDGWNLSVASSQCQSSRSTRTGHWSFHITVCLRLTLPLVTGALERSLGAIVDRHEVRATSAHFR